MMNVKKTLPKIGRRTYMRCDSAEQMFATLLADFNSRTWIRYDLGDVAPWIPTRGFQSTHLDKVRQRAKNRSQMPIQISIHAPG